MNKILIILIVSFLPFSWAFGQSPFTAPDSLLVIQSGVASFYGKAFHKRKTASGEVYDMWNYTAAHKHLPFGTLLKVTNLNNGYQVIVRVNDRLPKSSKRAIDLSRGSAEQLAMVGDGIVDVTLEVLSHQAIANLRDYYETVPFDLRLRLYYDSFQANKKEQAILQLKF
ncbi:septal ring lytic transglycosylase RlpA family protein [Lunatibacter salilacus]|uniref:septal ring lytic transglycosylase RlpA family protein n=1 Tax=Lunatibacter salilacus TaxID=2483804 RepID=UPI00131A85CB|nr:septal ring lytic transglycosylase RlpA family protein [Lunatibacter salilacus]